jgi:cytochrome c-type biogenesis protein
MIEIVLALLAGAVTVAAPCILPMLPILLGASVGGTSRARPFCIVLGFVSTFAATALVFGLFADALGASPHVVRQVAITLLGLFALLMIWRRPWELLTARLGSVLIRVGDFGRGAGSGSAGGLVIGMTLGVLWTPCAGPVLASILTLIATAENVARAAVLLVCYAIGAGLPMLAIAYGGQRAWSRARRLAPYTHRLQQAFGVVMVSTAIAMYLEYDLLATAWLAAFYPTLPGGL